MTARVAIALLFGTTLAGTTLAFGPVGCGTGGDDAPSVDAAPPPAGGFAGMWEVKGLTEDVARGDTRSIEGTVVISEKDGLYTAKSELETQYPSEGGAIDTDVIGTGSGTRKGNVLGGTAETQLVIGTVPGVQTEFAFVPRTVGPRIQSTWDAHFRRDGTLVVQLENVPLPGEEYSPTRTTLYGTRAEAGP